MSSLAERWMSRRSISSKNSSNSNGSSDQEYSAAGYTRKNSGNSSSNAPELKAAQFTEVPDAGLVQNAVRADQLSPLEVDRFCAAHLQAQGGCCPYLGVLDGCLIWEAKNKMWTIDRLPVAPERYLTGLLRRMHDDE